jgi:hypothetical protein
MLVIASLTHRQAIRVSASVADAQVEAIGFDRRIGADASPSRGGPPRISTDQKGGRGRQFHYAKLGLDQVAFGHRHGCLCREAARALRFTSGAAPRYPIPPIPIEHEDRSEILHQIRQTAGAAALNQPKSCKLTH